MSVNYFPYSYSLQVNKILPLFRILIQREKKIINNLKPLKVQHHSTQNTNEKKVN